MIPIIFASNGLTQWSQYDLTHAEGRLAGAAKCTVKEELNGVFNASLNVPYVALHASDITRNSIITLRANPYQDLQLFRVSKVGKVMKDGIVNVLLNHISYDLAKSICEPFTLTGTANLASYLKNKQMVSTAFTFSTDITDTTNTLTVDVPRSVRDIIGGMDKNVIETFRAEMEWDNGKVYILDQRGTDRGVTIEDGKNLLNYEQEDSVADTFDYVVGYWKDENTVVYSDPSFTNNMSATSKAGLVVDMTSVWGSTQPSKTMLNNRCTWYRVIEHPEQFKPSITVTADFKSLKKNNQYQLLANLEDIRLGDTVQVINRSMGVNLTARVISYEWDVLADEYDSVTIGDFRPSLDTTISNLMNAVK